MGLEQMAMSGVAAVGRHRRVSDALFRFTKWGNPFADERFSWPYPMYDRMRAGGPVAYGRPYRQWFVFGYDEVQEVLRSPHTATAPVGALLDALGDYSIDPGRTVWKRSFALRGPTVLPLTAG